MEDSGNYGDAGGSVLGALVGIFLILFLVAVFLGLLYWIYQDAKKHQVAVFNKPYDDDAPKVWVFICFLCFVIAAPYYFYRRAGVIALKAAAIPVAPIPPSDPSPAKETSPLTRELESQLKAAIELRAKGLITDAEFELKRRKILGL